MPLLRSIHLVVTIFTLTIIFALTSTTLVSASTAGNATTTTSSPSSRIELLPQPVYQREPSTSGVTPINQTHIASTFSANGTLTLPNTTETISITSTGSYLSSLDGTALGKEVITTEDGSESVTAKIYGVAQLEERRGIIIASFDINSTGRLAPLDGMILAGLIEYPPEENITVITLWEWQSGGPLPTTTSGSGLS